MDKLIVALDLDNLNQAKKLVNKLYPKVKFFKVGSQLFTSCGPEVVKFVKKKGAKVFLDLKFYDIPNTVANAARAAVRLRADIFNLHALGGIEMMEAALKAAKDEARKLKIARPKVIAVTVLTSQNTSTKTVLGLVNLVKKANLDGVVASAKEAQAIRRKYGRNFLIVTPGIRPLSADKNDQKRVTTPKDAVKNGSSHIVVGRPITDSKNPLKAADNILKEINDR